MLWFGTLGEVVLLAAVGYGVHSLSDVWWVATTVLYAPRWVWGAPICVLLPAALVYARRLTVVLIAAAGFLVGPIMGFEVPNRWWRPVSEAASQDPRLRVMTYNTGEGVKGPALRAVIDAVQPDIAVFQEQNGEVQDLVRKDGKAAYVSRCDRGLCIVSRYPIQTVDARDRREFWGYGGSGAIIRYELVTPWGVINVVNVHLATVREGLSEVQHRLWRGAADLIKNTELRARESMAAAEWTSRGKGPLLVMGDFNLPVESAIYRATWGDFTNAFSQEGFGLGATKRTRWHGIRINHVLARSGWEVERAWVGPSAGGDHLPMIAELHLLGR